MASLRQWPSVAALVWTVATVSASGRVDWNDCVVGGYGPQPGWTAPALSASAGPAKASVWRGRRFDPDTGYCWLGARFYDPAGHRYLSPDPLGHAASLGLYDYAGGDPVNFVDPDGRLVVGAAEGYVFGNWSSDIDSVDRPGRILGRAAGTMLGYMTPGYNVVAGYRDIAAGGFHFGRAIYDISANGLNEENGMALAMSGLELAGGFAGTKMFGAARAGSSDMAVARASSRPPPGYRGGPGAQWIGENLDDAVRYSNVKPSTGASAAKGASTHTTTFQGLEVRAVRDLSHIDDGTLRAMSQRGFAPKTIHGDSIVLHHHRQNPAGFIVEMPSSNQRIAPVTSPRNNPRQHPFGNTRGAGLTPKQRADFNSWRVQYWKWRAQEELARRAVGQ